jgi:hypothetical protein
MLPREDDLNIFAIFSLFHVRISASIRLLYSCDGAQSHAAQKYEASKGTHAIASSFPSATDFRGADPGDAAGEAAPPRTAVAGPEMSRRSFRAAGSRSPGVERAWLDGKAF